MPNVLSWRKLFLTFCLAVGTISIFSIALSNQSDSIGRNLRANQEWILTEKPLNFSALDVFDLRPFEKEAFLNYKEEIYRNRRARVSKYCQYLLQQNGGKKGSSFRVRTDTIIYDDKDRIAYCQIPKVASSTWCKHFAILSGASAAVLHEWRNAIQILAPETWPLPRTGRSLPDLFHDLDVSLVIVRHPFARLASIYYEKIVFNSGTAWDHVIKYIVEKYRNVENGRNIENDRNIMNDRNIEKDVNIMNDRNAEKEGTITDNLPTPDEFLLYVLECLTNDGDDSNPHWLPQFKSCPFCSVNFTVYSKMEEMSEDTAYVMYKAKLFGKILPELKDNSSMKKGDGREVSFWKDVSLEVVKRLYTFYKGDLEMFDYSFRKYFEDLGIELR